MPSSTVLAAAGHQNFAQIDVPLWAWIGLLAIIAGMLAVDLHRHRDDHEPTMREALFESGIWVACGLVFAVVVLLAWGGQAFGEYLSGYVIEKSLSVDNVFVWAIFFASFAIPHKYQHRVLFWGIFGALTLRAAFILAGTALITRFWWMLPSSACSSSSPGVKVIRHRDDEGDPGSRPRGQAPRPLHARHATRCHGQRFCRARRRQVDRDAVIRRARGHRDHRRGLRSRLRARDPRRLAASLPRLRVERVRDPRAAGDVLPARRRRERFQYLSHALGAILVFVGVKMGVSHWYHIDTFISLAVIVAMLTAAVALSIRRHRQHPPTAVPGERPAGLPTARPG